MLYRTLMFTPGNRPDRLFKSLQSTADALIWDVEDAVHPDEKAAARTVIRDVLDSMDKAPPKPIFIRVNQVGTPWFEDDARLAGHPLVRGMLLPKTESAAQVEQAWKLMDRKGELIVLIETAVGVRDLEGILESPLITGVALGAVDLAVDLNLTLTDSGLELLYFKSRIVTLARAAGIQGIYDSVFPDFNNSDSLRIRAGLTKTTGFTGQMCVHPVQIPVITEVYTPAAQEIDWAKRVIHALENEAKGLGVFTVDGKMVDRPVIERAKQVHQAALRWNLA
ncbi:MULTISPECIES: CoA ester lyase [unclassified Paenibacillus]|uniref:HpcH/HpaI aldolase/citrate lyase family protein n=1 Tax=unclassified Paenibacillus TaxID=185978 RepID=UPI001AE36D84|nr:MULTISPECIES: CoA ester lyase [unclassified Paenibacillus]MBP1153747.1 citrate lyase beta subunit [Paenibacillus sp. PvP091]MBP1170868.1 citrate lyase beta subunit [Paenibacillus sp. PvR098]MBP2441896.1 citrate lyase beta subunit [Paenibacillus sp. PvP052]